MMRTSASGSSALSAPPAPLSPPLSPTQAMQDSCQRDAYLAPPERRIIRGESQCVCLPSKLPSVPSHSSPPLSHLPSRVSNACPLSDRIERLDARQKPLLATPCFLREHARTLDVCVRGVVGQRTAHGEHTPIDRDADNPRHGHAFLTRVPALLGAAGMGQRSIGVPTRRRAWPRPHLPVYRRWRGLVLLPVDGARGRGALRNAFVPC
ncbi:hypothetical protein C8R44DRAFT_825085, partial [Mycena epipterygia]